MTRQEELREAVRVGNLDAVVALLRTGTEVNDGGSPSLLHWAVWWDKTGVILETLIEAGTDVDAQDGSGRTPLHCAAESRPLIRVLRPVVVAGADVDARDKYGLTPLALGGKGKPQQPEGRERAGQRWPDPPALGAALTPEHGRVSSPDRARCRRGRDGTGRTPLHYASPANFEKLNHAA